MDQIVDDKKKLDNKVVPFGAKTKSTSKKKVAEKPTVIDWSASTQDDAEFNRTSLVIDKHSDYVVDLIAQYFRENEIINPEKLTADQFRDMVLIKEAVKSLMFRVVHYHHDLQDFISNQMHIPLPTKDEE